MKVQLTNNTCWLLLLTCSSIAASSITFRDELPTSKPQFPVPQRPERDSSTHQQDYGQQWQVAQQPQYQQQQTNLQQQQQQQFSSPNPQYQQPSSQQQQFSPVYPQTSQVQPQSNVNQEQNRLAAVNSLVADLARGNTRFSLNMFKTLTDAIPNTDFMFSPFTVYSLLATLVEGATNPSATLNELLNVLEIPTNAMSSLGDIYDEIYKKLTIKTDTIELSVFQGIFHNHTHALQQQFRNVAESKYHTKVTEFQKGKSADQVLSTINEIVRTATNGNLQAAFRKSEIQSAPMLMLSAIHFKGQWANPFNRTHTKTETFYDEFGNPVGDVQMMFERAVVAYSPIKELESHVIQLPYGSQNRLGMIVILPRKNVSLSEVATKLAGYSLTEMFKVLDKSLKDFEDDEIEIHLPRFSTNTDLALNSILAQQGLRSIFSSDAELNRMNPNIFLSRLIHKAKIDVDEEGTVASAVTGGVFANKSSAPRFYANRPFLYLIVDRETNLILFCGQMRNQPHVNQRPNTARSG
ncbi:serine protease inhibitor 77Ba-like [Culicoides brevitarsis]|uniref:serine protease inhibitor 77Ba-like n=1 Tax=Culicoides brevitarsis TaxID=469753 RepID=UPI00307C2354